jgi:hypothetical protein
MYPRRTDNGARALRIARRAAAFDGLPALRVVDHFDHFPELRAPH